MVIFVSEPLAHNSFAYCENDVLNETDPTGYLVWPGEIHRYVQNVLACYIWMCLGCFTYINYFIRFNRFNYGFADLYAKKWNEIWEVKPDKNNYTKSGPKQLQKYLNGISGSKKGRNLGSFTTYYYSGGFYEVQIRSNSNDGMIYYKYNYCWRINAAILIAVTSIVLIATVVGAPAGAAGLAGAIAIA